jgi:hypothetical protein
MKRASELGQKNRWAVILALARRPNKFSVKPISDVEWSDLGLSERVIALRSREIKPGSPTGVPHSPGHDTAANGAADPFDDLRRESHETRDVIYQ